MSEKNNNSANRILVVDDDDDNIRVLTKTLEWKGYEVKSINTGANAVAFAIEWNPQLILLDINMPGTNGLDLLKAFRRASKDYTSVIFVSARSETEDVIKGLDAGADDYVCKPFNPEELLARVRAQLRIKELHDQLRTANIRLQELADTDDLTGLLNMRSLYPKLEQEIARAKRFNRNIAVVMMDMDNFKSVNDDHDHLFGSFVISEIGKIIRDTIRVVDLGARYGGDEFLVVLTEIALPGARTFCERLRSGIEKYLFQNGKDSINLTASIGLAVSSPSDDKTDARALIRAADKALYDAKHTGRNCVRVTVIGARPE